MSAFDPTAPLLNPEELPESGHSPALDGSAGEYLTISAIARRDMVIGQYLIDANIRPILLARVVFRNATRPAAICGSRYEEPDHERCRVEDSHPGYEDCEG